MKSLAYIALLLPAVLAAEMPKRFDVSTVKRNVDTDNGSRISVQPGGKFMAGSVTLRRLIRTAYQLNEMQILGGPGWLDSSRWDVTAKAEGLPEPFRPEYMMPLLQEFLADRFQMRSHRESREMPVYELRLGKNGPKLQPTKSDAPLAGFRNSAGQMIATKATMVEFSAQIARQLGRSVIDRTGLGGAYDFTLEWSPDIALQAPAEKTDGPSLFTAIQEQLGLRLQSAKGMVEVLVIDSAALPEEN